MRIALSALHIKFLIVHTIQFGWKKHQIAAKHKMHIWHFCIPSIVIQLHFYTKCKYFLSLYSTADLTLRQKMIQASGQPFRLFSHITLRFFPSCLLVLLSNSLVLEIWILNC